MIGIIRSSSNSSSRRRRRKSIIISSSIRSDVGLISVKNFSLTVRPLYFLDVFVKCEHIHILKQWWMCETYRSSTHTALMQRGGQCRYGRVWIKFVRTDSSCYKQHVSNQRAPLAVERVNKRWHQRSDVIIEDVVLNKFWTPSPVSLCSCNEGAGVLFLRSQVSLFTHITGCCCKLKT